jgi:hypothetical protein
VAYLYYSGGRWKNFTIEEKERFTGKKIKIKNCLFLSLKIDLMHNNEYDFDDDTEDQKLVNAMLAFEGKLNDSDYEDDFVFNDQLNELVDDAGLQF